FTFLGNDQRGFLLSGRALIVIGSPVKGLTPFRDFLAFTSRRASTPMIGKRTLSPPAAEIAAFSKVLSNTALRSARLSLIAPLRPTSVQPRTPSYTSLIKENLVPFVVFLALAMFNPFAYLRLLLYFPKNVGIFWLSYKSFF